MPIKYRAVTTDKHKEKISPASMLSIDQQQNYDKCLFNCITLLLRNLLHFYSLLLNLNLPLLSEDYQNKTVQLVHFSSTTAPWMSIHFENCHCCS